MVHMQAGAVFQQGFLHGMDVADGSHHPGEAAAVVDGPAADPVPLIVAGGAVWRDYPHFKGFPTAVADIVHGGGGIFWVDKGFVGKKLGIPGELPALHPLSGARFITDEGIGIGQVFKHDVGAGLHGHPVHLLFLVQLLL